jgi:hypothetical protein
MVATEWELGHRRATEHESCNRRQKKPIHNSLPARVVGI